MSIGNGFLGIQNTIANSQRITTIAEELFLEGKSFSTRGYFDLSPGDGSRKYISFDPTGCSADQILFEPLKFKGTLAGPIKIDIYANPTLTVGGRTPIEATNRRSGFPGPLCTLEFINSANVTSDGVLIPGSRFVGSASAPGKSSESDESAGGLPFELIPSVIYLIKFVNFNSTDALVEYNVTWFEN